MKRILLFFLVLILFLSTVHSSGEQQINWLSSQQNPTTGLIDSYEGDGQNHAYTYDQALAIIAFTESGEIEKAIDVLDKMDSLQLSNGAWYQCYNAATGAIGHSGCNYYPVGDISWIVMAINYYEVITADFTYSDIAGEALAYLDTLRNTDPSDEKYGSLRLCSRIACEYPNAISTENNYDAYSAYYYRGILESDSTFLTKADLIKDYLLFFFSRAR